MTISHYSVKRPVTITVLYILAMGIAATMVPGIAVDLYPSTVMPVLSVSTSYSGAGPEDVERNITNVLERSLASSRGLTSMTSNSSFGSSNINLSFAYGTDMDKAVTDVQTLVSRLANSLPDGAGTPTVRRFDMSASAMMQLVVKGNYAPDQLRLYAEDEIQAQLERIDGVASAAVTGGTSQMVTVAVSLNRLAAFNLTMSDVANALRNQDILASGGTLKRGEQRYQLMTRQELQTVDQIKNLTVKTVGIGQDGRSHKVRLSDIAEVSVEYNDNAARVYFDGQSAVFIQITSESDSNQVIVARAVRAALDGINATLPSGVSLEVSYDNTSLINATLSQVYNNAIQGIILAMIIIFIFLRNIKGTLIIGFSIPISIFLTIMFMAIFGFTLNLLTMTGLIMALGMTVDASIVILENVHGYRFRGAKSDSAAILGSQEMFRAIVTSTTTTLCVFIPLIIFKNDLEMIGQMANDLIFTVIIALVCSLVVALTLVPAFCGSILKLDTRKQKPLKNPLLRFLDDSIEAVLTRVDNGYRTAVEYCLNHRLIVLLLVLIILVFSFMQFSGIGMNLFIRSRTDDTVTLAFTLPDGSSIEASEEILWEMMDIIEREIKNYKSIIGTVRQGGCYIQIILPPPAEQTDTPTSINAQLAPYLSGFPGISSGFRGGGRSMSSSSSVEMTVTSRDADAISEVANEIKDIMIRYLPEIEEPTVNINEGAPQLYLDIDRERATALGVSAQSITQEIRAALDGTTATSIVINDRTVNVQVQLREEDRAGIKNLDALFVRSGQNRIPLSNIVTITEGRAPNSIRHENQERVVRISGSLPPGVASTAVQLRLEETVKQHLIPRDSVTVRYVGEAQEIERYNTRFIFITGVAIFLVFGLMASQFESFVDPLIIMFSIPLLFIGVVWIYKIGNEAMSVFSLLGVVALVGIVVNNGIVMVDYTNMLRARGLSVHAACLEASRNRLRPILMTSLTTILGMVPIAFFPGAGAETIQPIGKTFVGGLTVSSIMTLFVTPIMYSIFNSWKDKRLKKSGKS
ncbi:MAG: efflux RND transporter permease subunit [Spirochaetaceae bacterium]|jgi:HAE1 family hydrophobic/amphiphilic exporter-1|nr:efflux RND transporter permease subunit [Spirochaetaceae bacterium]